MRATILHATALCALLTLLPVGMAVGQDEFEREPIQYSQATPENPVSQLEARLASGDAKAEYDEEFGYLPAILEALQIPVESQMFVYSKTSLQRNRISPRTPRAIYFNDDIYLGYCQSGNVLEISVADPKLGAVFYSVDQKPAERLQFRRETDKCLQCHATSQTGNVPGHLVRSLFVNASGMPLLAEGSHRVDHTTPIADRWGGWYVTGTHGEQPHLGNVVIREQRVSRPFENVEGHNVVDLADRFPVKRYLSPHSDIVALMVLEHQVLVHNLLTKANYSTRQALHYEAELNRALGEPPDNRLASTTTRIQSAGDKLLESLLFVDEAPITAPIAGTSQFAEKFSLAGPRDSKGRSLRDLDMNKRMFKYPCSYLIYSPAFTELPEEVKSYVLTRLHNVLTGTDPDKDKKFVHLTPEDRQAILEILQETLPGPWKS